MHRIYPELPWQVPLSIEPKTRAPLWQALAIALAVATIYFFAARLSQVLLGKSDHIAAFWPAAGVASGAMIVTGYSTRWPVLLGVIAAIISVNLLSGGTISTTLPFVFSNCAEAVIVAGLIDKIFGPSFELNTVRRVIGLFAATIVGVAVSATIVTSWYHWSHAATTTAPIVWIHWFAANTLGTFVTAPLVIGLASLMRNVPTKREAAEATSLFVLEGILCAFLCLPNNPWTVELVTASLCPLLVWSAARLSPGLNSIGVFICAITIMIAVTFSIGVFSNDHLPLAQRIESAQASILAITFGALVLTALFSERRLDSRSLLESEARLQEALRAGGVMAFEWDPVTDQVRHSQNAASILGFDSKTILTGFEVTQRIHPDDRAHITSSLAGINPDNPSYTATFRYQRTDGAGEVWLQQVGTAQFDSRGSPRLLRGLTTDITERKHHEEELRRAQKIAEEADRGKSIFLAAASHDLRQPLQTLRLLHGALEQEHPDRGQQGIITGIGRSIDTMARTLSSLLDINGLETGTLRPSISDFSLDELFQSVMSEIVPLLTEKGLESRVMPCDLVIRSDRRMLEEMIRNLLSNALRYTDRGKILLGCRRTRNHVRIQVWDTGVGIRAEHLPHIFEEYYHDAERGGFGLGLAIVRRLSEILGHRVDVRSIVGKGTGFSIEVPRGQSQGRVAESVPAPDHSGALFRGSVLVIEDDISLRSALIRLLQLKGISAIGAATVGDTVTLIERNEFSPDVLLCDYNLAGTMNGLESVESLRSTLAWHVPAIVMTGDIRLTTIDALYSQGVSVLVKPFVSKDLIQLLNLVSRGSEFPDRDRRDGLVGQVSLH